VIWRLLREEVPRWTVPHFQAPIVGAFIPIGIMIFDAIGSNGISGVWNYVFLWVVMTGVLVLIRIIAKSGNLRGIIRDPNKQEEIGHRRDMLARQRAEMSGMARKAEN